jgi:hypothetical protein
VVSVETDPPVPRPNSRTLLGLRFRSLIVFPRALPKKKKKKKKRRIIPLVLFVLVLSHLHLRFALVMMRKTMISPHRVGGKNNQKNERVLHFEKSSSFSSFSPRAHPSISLLKCDDDDERALLCVCLSLCRRVKT